MVKHERLQDYFWSITRECHSGNRNFSGNLDPSKSLIEKLPEYFPPKMENFATLERSARPCPRNNPRKRGRPHLGKASLLLSLSPARPLLRSSAGLGRCLVVGCFEEDLQYNISQRTHIYLACVQI